MKKVRRANESFFSSSSNPPSFRIGPTISVRLKGAGVSISFAKILNRIVANENFIISINLGGGHVFYEDIDPGNGWYPFLNVQSNIVFDF